MYKPNTNAVATSAIAIFRAFFAELNAFAPGGLHAHAFDNDADVHVANVDDVFQVVTDANEGGQVEVYAWFADVAEESEKAFQRLFDPDDGCPGVWAYEVDEEVGTAIGKHVAAGILADGARGARFPTSDKVRTIVDKFARAMLGDHVKAGA